MRGEYQCWKHRFDIAIFDGPTEELICTVEVKLTGDRRAHRCQLNKYEQATGKPCILTPTTMRAAIAEVLSLTEDHSRIMAPAVKVLPDDADDADGGDADGN